MTNAKTAAVVIVALFFVFTFFGGFKVVSPGYRGIRVTLGSVASTPVGEGLPLKLPWLTEIKEVSVRQGTMELDAHCFSQDLQQVDCKLKVLWRPSEGRVVTLYRNIRAMCLRA